MIVQIAARHGLPPERRSAAAAAERSRVRGNRDPPARPRVGRGAAFSGRARAAARRARPAGNPGSGAVRRRGDVGRRLLHLHRRAGPRRSRRRALGCRAQRPVLGAHPAVRHRRAEGDVSRAAGARREDRRLGPDRIHVGQRCRRHADHGRPGRCVLGPEWLEDLHDARPRRARDGRHGGDRQGGRAARASPPSSSSTALPG